MKPDAFIHPNGITGRGTPGILSEAVVSRWMIANGVRGVRDMQSGQFSPVYDDNNSSPGEPKSLTDIMEDSINQCQVEQINPASCTAIARGQGTNVGMCTMRRIPQAGAHNALDNTKVNDGGKEHVDTFTNQEKRRREDGGLRIGNDEVGKFLGSQYLLRDLLSGDEVSTPTCIHCNSSITDSNIVKYKCTKCKRSTQDIVMPRTIPLLWSLLAAMNLQIENMQSAPSPSLEGNNNTEGESGEDDPANGNPLNAETAISLIESL